jgi:integral membrane sensor domain MASE1
MKHAQEPTYSFVVLTFVLILVTTALAWISAKFMQSGTSGVSLIYIAVAFMILFTLWFGLYGAIAAYIGSLLGGILSTDSLLQHPEIAVIWAVAGLLEVLIPLVAVRKFDVNLTLQSRRDWTIVILFAVLINNLVGAAWGVFTLTLLPESTINFASAFSTWLVGNIIVSIILVPLALRLLTEKVTKSRLFVRKYWD